MIEFRPATPRDIEFLTSVNISANEERLSTREDWDADAFARDVEASARNQVAGKVEHSITYVIELDGTAVGRLRLIRPGNERHVAGIQILPSHQRKGIGSRVMQRIVDEAQQSGLPVTLEVEKDNPRAKRLYQRLSFVVIEDRGDRELMRWQLNPQVGST